MTEAVIESGFAKVEAGVWLCGHTQPTACRGKASVTALRGFIVPDRGWVRKAETTEEAWFGSSDAPFLTRLDALPDESLNLVSAKLLVAPFAARTGAESLKLIPLSFNRSTPVTHFQSGWAVAATKGRVARVVLEAGETLTVRPEAVVAWTGSRPTGFCPKLSVWDMILPRGPRNLAFTFHGPAVVWFEGAIPQMSRRGAPARTFGGRYAC